MKNYYSDKELKDMMHMSLRTTLRWLEEARRFFNKITTEKNQEASGKDDS
jgi:hypothetical protein